MNEFPPPDPSTSDDEAQRLARRLEALRDRQRPDSATRPPAQTPTRRRHAARGARLAALGLSVASTGGLATWFALSGSGPTGEQTAGAIVQTSQTVNGGAESDTAPSAVATESAADTVVDGAVYENRWGAVQVRATFDPSGELVEVTPLQTPGGRGQSIQINRYAVPRLTSEALTAQSAHVDTVSGATYTSNDYRQSLQSAIDAARAAGATQLA